MFERIVAEMTQARLADMIVESTGINVASANKIVKNLTFSQYFSITEAIRENKNRVIEQFMQLCENSYSDAEVAVSGAEDGVGIGGQAKTPDGGIDLSTVSTGDNIMLSPGSKSTVKTKNSFGDDTILDTSDNKHLMISNRPIMPADGPLDKTAAQQQIDDLKRRAGIPTENNLEEENVAEMMTAQSCAAMGRNGRTTPNQIIKKHKRKLKPGPKDGGNPYAKR